MKKSKNMPSLKSILAEEARILLELVDLEEEAQKVLIKGDARALEKINDRKDELIQKMNEEEEKRSVCVPQGLTLSEYILQVSPPDQTELEELKTKILYLNNSLQRIQRINKYLLQHNLKFIEYAMKLLFPQKGETLYSSSGLLRDKAAWQARLLDSNA